MAGTLIAFTNDRREPKDGRGSKGEKVKRREGEKGRRGGESQGKSEEKEK